MKIRAVLEFDLEYEDGSPINERKQFVSAAEATDNTIRTRLMGEGFLADDMLIGTYKLNVNVVDGTIGDPDTA